MRLLMAFPRAPSERVATRGSTGRLSQVNAATTRPSRKTMPPSPSSARIVR